MATKLLFQQTRLLFWVTGFPEKLFTSYFKSTMVEFKVEINNIDSFAEKNEGLICFDLSVPKEDSEKTQEWIKNYIEIYSKKREFAKTN